MANETTRIFVPDGGNDALTTALLANNGGMGMRDDEDYREPMRPGTMGYRDPYYN